jgi:SulP family sulfate permease
MLSRFTPFLRWLPGISREDAKADFMAGFAGSIVVLPQGVAFATIAGMPPEYGLYAGMIPAIVAALLGSSRHLVSGPTTAASVVLFSALSVHATPGSPDYVTLALTLTFMVGVFELLLGLARMGALVNFISHSVVVGFTAGAAMLIAAKQLKFFFGVEMPPGGHIHDILIAFVNVAGDINPYVTAVALVTLFGAVALRRWAPKFPYLVAAMVIGSLVALLLNQLFGEEVTHIAQVGALPAHLPPVSAPDLSLDHIKVLAPTALAVTLFALTEAVSIGRSLAARGGYRIDGNQEFVGQGLSNIAGSFFSGYVATGSFNRSGLNYEAGARSPLAAVFAGLLLMVIVLFIAPLAAYLPKAAMAGVLFVVAWGLIDFTEIRRILRASKGEAAVLAVTFFSALFLELEFAIFAGVLLSLVLYLSRVSKPAIFRRVPDPRSPKRKFVTDTQLPECPQLRFARIDGSVFFGSVDHVQNTFDLFRSKNPDQRHLAIIAKGINFVDLQGGEALVKEAKRRHADGGGLYLIHVKPGLRASLEACGCLEKMGAQNYLFETKTEAIRGIYQRLDKSICATCDKRIFTECQAGFGPGKLYP